MRLVALVVVFVVLVVPVGLAQGEDVRQYVGFVATETSETGEVAQTAVEIAAPHTWDTSQGLSVLEVRASYVVEPGSLSNTMAAFRVLWNATAVPGCEWSLNGGSSGGHRENPTVELYCALESFVAPGSHSFEVERTDVQGTPVASATISIVLHQRETMSMNINIENIETWMPIVLTLGVVLSWIVYVTLTWRIPDLGLRLLMLAAGLLFLVLPVSGLVLGVLALGHAGVLAYAAFQWSGSK